MKPEPTIAQQLAEKTDSLGNKIPVHRSVPHGVMKIARNDTKRSTAGRWYSGKIQPVGLSGSSRRKAERAAA